MDNYIFGHEGFWIKDSRLFGIDTSQHPKATIVDGPGADCANCSMSPVTICNTYTVCGECLAFRPGGGEDPCCNQQTYFICTTYWTDAEGGTGGGGTQGSGGSGGGNPPGWWEDPCEEDPSGSGRIEPCDGVMGWGPVEDSIPANQEPVDSLLKKLSLLANKYSDSLFSLSMSQDAEWFFAIVELNNVLDTLHTHTDGSDIAVNPNWYVYGGRKLKGGWHCHQDTDSMARSGPSGDDLSQLWENKNIQNFIFFTDCGNVRFAFVLEDTQKAEAWFRISGNGPVALPGRFFNMVYNDPRHTTQMQIVSVEKMIQILGNSSACGIGFYKSKNSEKTLYDKLN